jgi:hypothetical protein
MLEFNEKYPTPDLQITSEKVNNSYKGYLAARKYSYRGLNFTLKEAPYALIGAASVEPE